MIMSNNNELKNKSKEEILPEVRGMSLEKCKRL